MLWFFANEHIFLINSERQEHLSLPHLLFVSRAIRGQQLFEVALVTSVQLVLVLDVAYTAPKLGP